MKPIGLLFASGPGPAGLAFLRRAALRANIDTVGRTVFDDSGRVSFFADCLRLFFCFRFFAAAAFPGVYFSGNFDFATHG
jgi:hypothetical protein